MPDNPGPGPHWKNQGQGPKKDASSEPKWKKGGAADAAASQSEGTRNWQNQKATPAASVSSRGFKIWITIGLFVSLFAGLVAWFIYLQPLKPACLVLLGSSYDVNLALPHNAYGWHGLQDMAHYADQAGFVGSLFSARRQLQLINPGGRTVDITGKEQWEKVWKEVPKDFQEKTAIVFLALHGGADGAGPYLFQGDLRGRDKIYLKDILADIKKWPSDKNVLLVLEPAQVAAHWTSGILQNQFASALKNLEKEIDQQNETEKYPGVVVLCASDANEISWVSEKWGHTLFVHYLLEGLQGAAQPKDSLRITAWDLYEYVGKMVAATALSNRRARQTPVLLGGKRAKTIELVQVSANKSLDEGPTRENSAWNEWRGPLKDAWNKCDALAKIVPGPAVYTPHLWRLYRDTLLRWEQLARAGWDKKKIGELRDLCAKVAEEIENNVRVEIRSTREINRAAPLPAVLGLGTTQARDDGDLAKRLDYGKRCRQLFASLKPGDFAKGEKESKARTRLTQLEKDFPSWPRPAEIQYLDLLLENAVSNVPPKNLLTALEVRQRAEETAWAAPGDGKAGHPYGEIVYPWIKKKVADADTERREGEDLLFGNSEEQWKKAEASFKKAEEKYRDIRADAALLREALDERDRALADLPYYAQWLANLPFQEADKAKVLELGKQLERLAKNVSDLDWCLTEYQGQDLDQAQNKSTRNGGGLTPRTLLKSLQADVRKDFEGPITGLKDRYQKYWQDLKEVNQPKEWLRREAALAVPLIHDAESRIAFLEVSKRIAKKLEEGEQSFAQEEKAPEKAGEEYQKRLAVAVMVGQGAEEQAALDLGRFWQELPDKITANLKASCQNPKLKEAAKQLREADFLCRILPGGLVPAYWPAGLGLANWQELPYAPPKGLRDLRLHDLLLEQAQRSREDYYWSTEAADDPYYVQAARAYAKLAQTLAESKTATEPINRERRREAVDLADKVKKVELIVSKPTELFWTSQQRFPLTWSVKTDGVPKGKPMFWLVDGPDANRTPLADWSRNSVTYSLPKPLQERDEEASVKIQEATLAGFYRGQKILSKVPLQAVPPDIVVKEFPARQAGAAFRLDKDFNYGAIAIVLDCSPSMRTPIEEGKTRFRHAIAALDVMLKAIPDNTFVSLMVFIDRTGKGTSYPFLRDPEEWQQHHRLGLIADLSRLKENEEFYGNSPIAEALIKSLAKGFPPPYKYKGPKLIVALTDGDDNQSFESQFVSPADAPVHNKKIRSELRKAFRDSGTEVHIVCFNNNMKDDPEVKNAEAQFKNTVAEFEPAGRFHVQPDPVQLGIDLELAIRPKLRLLKEGSAVPGFKGEETPINSYSNGQLDWHPLDPGNYTASVQKDKEQEVALKAGDFMILTLTRNGHDVFFERTLIAKEEGDKIIKDDSKAPLRAQKGSLVISVLQNQLDKKENVVHQLIAMEEDRGKEKARLEQRLPDIVWLESKVRNGKVARVTWGRDHGGRMNWARDYGYPALAFNVEIEGWPREETATQTTLWWAAKPEIFTSLKVGEALKQKYDQGPLALGPGIRLESVKRENWQVANAAGQKSAKDCLVVRIGHDANKPVLVKLREKGLCSEKHLVFSEAKKYTALFWDLPDPESEQYTLDVIALDALKNSAREGKSVDFLLPPPSGNIGPARIILPNSP